MDPVEGAKGALEGVLTVVGLVRCSADSDRDVAPVEEGGAKSGELANKEEVEEANEPPPLLVLAT